MIAESPPDLEYPEPLLAVVPKPRPEPIRCSGCRNIRPTRGYRLGREWHRLCDLCAERALVEAFASDAGAARRHRYPAQQRLRPDRVEYSDGTREIVMMPRLNPERGMHLMPLEMVEDAPTGSPFGTTPHRALIDWIVARDAGWVVDQAMAEQMMGDERHDLWMVWIHAKRMTDAEVAARCDMPLARVKVLVKLAVLYLTARVNYGAVRRRVIV